MSLVRILVDGHSLLQHWKDLAPGKPRHSELARQELISRLTQYHDATNTPLTIVFNVLPSPLDPPETSHHPEVEVIFTRPGQTAGQLIHRVTHRLAALGPVQVVTDDPAQYQSALAVGARFSNCSTFIASVNEAVADLERAIHDFNATEQKKFIRQG